MSVCPVCPVYPVLLNNIIQECYRAGTTKGQLMWEQLRSASSEAGTYPGPGLWPHDGNHLLARRRPGWRAYLASAQTLGGPDGLGKGCNNCRQTNETRKNLI